MCNDPAFLGGNGQSRLVVLIDEAEEEYGSDLIFAKYTFFRLMHQEARDPLSLSFFCEQYIAERLAGQGDEDYSRSSLTSLHVPYWKAKEVFMNAISKRINAMKLDMLQDVKLKWQEGLAHEDNTGRKAYPKSV